MIDTAKIDRLRALREAKEAQEAAVRQAAAARRASQKAARLEARNQLVDALSRMVQATKRGEVTQEQLVRTVTHPKLVRTLERLGR